MASLATISRVLQRATERVAEEVGTFIGEEFQCSPSQPQLRSAEELGGALGDKLVVARMEVSGNKQGEAYLVTSTKTAILFGGKLIMLPPAELNKRGKAGDFDGELADAFSEIVNIVSGALSATFLEANIGKLHFKSLGVAQRTMPVDGSLPEDFSEGSYCHSQTVLKSAQGTEGLFHFIFPPSILDLEQPGQAAPATGGASATAAVGALQADGGPGVVVLVAENREEGQRLAAMLEKKEIAVKTLDYQGDFRRVLGGEQIAGVVLVMKEVGDQGFAAAIKLRSVMPQNKPLIAAGPEWTRKTVLQAVKYGVCDILVTPVAEQDLLGKLREHVFKARAQSPASASASKS